MTNVNPSPTLRRLERGDGPISGVAAGLADYFSIDPTLARIGFVAGTLIGGPVVPVCYLAAWAIIPPTDETSIAPPPPPPFTADPTTPADPSQAAPTAPAPTPGAPEAGS